MPSDIIIELKDDSQIIPRSSSVVVKRMPAVRPGKGKASMYIGATPVPGPVSESAQRPGSSTTWHKGAMSKRFDGKEEPSANTIPKPVSLSLRVCWLDSFYFQSTPVKSAVTKDDEAAAMAAMFQAQSANWEETQEKMSQFVYPAWASVDVVDQSLMNMFVSPLYRLVMNSATRVYSNARGTGFGRASGKPHIPQVQAQHQDRPLPPSYVCYRCGQKGLSRANFFFFHSLPHTLSKVIGSRTAQQTTTASLTTARGLNEQLGYPEAC
jgi:protein MPE1